MLGAEGILIFVCIDCVLLAFNLAAMCYIFIRYMVRLKIKNTLVLLFYLFAFLTTVFRIIQTVSILSTVNDKIMDKEEYHEDELGPESISDSLSMVCTTAMGLVIVATMYKIAVSLQMLMDELSPQEH